MFHDGILSDANVHYHVADSTGQQMVMVPAPPSSIPITHPPQYYYHTQQVMPTQAEGNDALQGIRLHSGNHYENGTYGDYPEKVTPPCYNG